MLHSIVTWLCLVCLGPIRLRIKVTVRPGPAMGTLQPARRAWVRTGFCVLASTVTAACGSADSVAAVVAVHLPAMPPTPATDLCSPAAQRPCLGPSGCEGTQVCSKDGAAYGICYCRSDCADQDSTVYVIATSNVLYGFDPRSLVFTTVGTLSCSITPMSLAVDRHGTGWVLSDEGQLYRVDVATAACQKTSYVPGQKSFFKFGMSFVSNEPGGLEETLYIGGDGILGTIDTESLQVSVVGPWSLEASELTGNADAKLFAFSAPDRHSVVDIDKETGAAVRTTPQPTLGAYNTFAMASWGGDLWLFTDSRVHRDRPIDQKTLLASTDIGFSIVGAGVSTCARTQ
jgi:hypothetical protein